jgi:hypothetical protein
MDTTFPGYDGKPIEWVRVHKAPDYVNFNHSAHVNRGISCQSCHGDIHKMEVVYQAKQLSMAWCIECHRNPEPHLRPQEFVTKLDWERDPDVHPTGEELKEQNHINPQVNCAVCHR